MAPNFHPGEGDFSNLDGALNWMGWPSDGNNKAPQGGVDITVTDGDKTYLTTVADKSLIARALIVLRNQQESAANEVI